ncbi:MAG: hypothetical protein WD845_00690 [Pirellulales bacterium]
MGLLDRLRLVFSGKRKLPATAAADLPSTITVYDAFGRRLEVPRDEWASKVLPDALQAAWDDADELYNSIVQALEDGFIDQIVQASDRLMAIDPNRQRSHTVRSIVLAKSGDPDAAERLLTALVDEQGPSGVVLTNLAKIFADQGRQAEADATLWRGIELDPNQDNGLLWYCATKRDNSGREDDFWKAMSTAAAIEGSWRPQLWLARHALDQNDLAAARRFYEHVLKLAAGEPHVLAMISGDLGNHGQTDAVIELVLPGYDPKLGDPLTGLNLLQACVETNNLAEGEKLLQAMFAADLPPLKERLFEFANVFDKMRAAQPRLLAQETESIRIEVLPFDKPLWSYGLHNPTWLFEPIVERSDSVVLVPLANTTPTDQRQAMAQREDDLGRTTRSLPAYLAESLFFWTALEPRFMLPVVRGGGPVVVGKPWDAAQIMSFSEGARYAVAGTVCQNDETLDIDLSIWDCMLVQVIERFRYSATSERFGATILTIERDIVGCLAAGDVSAGPRMAYYARPDALLAPNYLTCLGQTLMLSLVQNDVLSKDSLWGERNILEYCMQYALESPHEQVPKILFLSAVAKCHDYGSAIAGDFRRAVSQFVDQETDHNCAFYRLTPLALRIFDPERFHLVKAELLGGATGSYREWLEALMLDSP